MKKLGRLLAAMLFCICLPVSAFAASYSDSTTHWATREIEYVSQKGLMDGVSVYSFAPDAPATRAVVVTAMYRLAGSPEDGGAAQRFADVPPSASYFDAVSWAAQCGVVNGVTETAFRPSENITREQLAAILQRFAAWRDDALPHQNAQTAYADEAQIRSYAAEAVAWAQQTGLLTGKTNNCFDPEGLATRAEIATILQRYGNVAAIELPDAAPPAGVQTKTDEAFYTDLGVVTRTETTVTAADSTHQMRRYVDTAGCTVDMGRVTAKTSLPAHLVEQYALSGTSGTLRRYDLASGQWIVEPIRTGTLPRGMYYIRTAQGESIAVTPQSYRSRENGMMEYLPAYDGVLAIERQGSGLVLTVSAPAMPAGMFCDFLVLQSDRALIDWNDSASLARWSNYRFTDANRWCYDGYYYQTPSNYYPSGENYYYELPAAYIAGKMARDAGQPASRALGLAMLDVMHTRRNSFSYVQINAGSLWLQESYHIAPGYYDTRFATELALADLNACEVFGVIGWLNDVCSYGDFLVEYAQEHHFAFGEGEGQGWLVQDYWNPDGRGQPTHASLNHHAAEAVFLYRLANATGKEKYSETADRLVRGIENTVDRWLMPDGNLYYAYLPDGTMMTGDYPYLTYNDLLDLQRLVTAQHGVGSSAIDKLMASKLRWMNANGVTEYNR